MTTKTEKKQTENAPVAKQAKHKTKAKAKEEAANAKVTKGKAKDNKKVAEVAAPVADKSKVKKNRVKRAEDAPKKPMAPFFCY